MKACNLCDSVDQKKQQKTKLVGECNNNGNSKTNKNDSIDSEISKNNLCKHRTESPMPTTNLTDEKAIKDSSTLKRHHIENFLPSAAAAQYESYLKDMFLAAHLLRGNKIDKIQTILK